MYRMHHTYRPPQNYPQCVKQRCFGRSQKQSCRWSCLPSPSAELFGFLSSSIFFPYQHILQWPPFTTYYINIYFPLYYFSSTLSWLSGNSPSQYLLNEAGENSYLQITKKGQNTCAELEFYVFTLLTARNSCKFDSQMCKLCYSKPTNR